MVVKKVSKMDLSRKKESDLPYGLISYILGIVAIVEAIFSPFIGIIFAIIGLTLSRKEISSLALKAKKLNTIALIVGIVVLIIYLIFLVVFDANQIMGGL
ncbi:MAG: hypothetical protein NUV46_02275 [Nanoarchaeota archaeon]|nr:hypothetical protein [Nanoarchaeota archaeon]